MTHELKTWPEYFDQIWIGDKTFELRKFDRPYEQGDFVLLREYDPQKAAYTGRKVRAEIGYIYSQPALGLKDGYCILSLLNIGI